MGGTIVSLVPVFSHSKGQVAQPLWDCWEDRVNTSRTLRIVTPSCECVIVTICSYEWRSYPLTPTLVNGKTRHTGGQRHRVRPPPSLKQLWWLLGGSHRSSRNQGLSSWVGGLLGPVGVRGCDETCVYPSCPSVGPGPPERVLQEAAAPCPG